jgi:hypothetical protein
MDVGTHPCSTCARVLFLQHASAVGEQLHGTLLRELLGRDTRQVCAHHSMEKQIAKKNTSL